MALYFILIILKRTIFYFNSNRTNNTKMYFENNRYGFIIISMNVAITNTTSTPWHPHHHLSTASVHNHRNPNLSNYRPLLKITPNSAQSVPAHRHSHILPSHSPSHSISTGSGDHKNRISYTTNSFKPLKTHPIRPLWPSCIICVKIAAENGVLFVKFAVSVAGIQRTVAETGWGVIERWVGR